MRRGWRRRPNENGAAILELLVTLPLLLWLFFAMFDVALFLKHKSEVDRLITQGATAVAINGGDNPSWGSGKSTSAALNARIQELCGNGTRCTVIVSCFPTQAPYLSSAFAGCSGQFTYKPITGFGSHPVFSLGLSSGLTRTYSLSESMPVRKAERESFFR